MLKAAFEVPYEVRADWHLKDPLSPSSWCSEAFLSHGLLVLDDFFTPTALAELWSFATKAGCFRSLRPGYLGAFAADGCLHPIIRRAAERLHQRLSAAQKG